MVQIPGGVYVIGSPPQHPLANRAAIPEHRVTIKPFRIDRTEVTNAQFTEFLNALPVKPLGSARGQGMGQHRVAAAASRVQQPALPVHHDRPRRRGRAHRRPRRALRPQSEP
jgi:iron(II)-dependent oxidoreductase